MYHMHHCVYFLKKLLEDSKWEILDLINQVKVEKYNLKIQKINEQ